MLKLNDGILLYHGSYCEVQTPVLDKCLDYKDFGKGFYLTTSKEQAEKFIATSLRKAKSQQIIDENQAYGVVTTYRLQLVDQLKEYAFDDADREWLHCVVGHRKEGTFSDVVDAMGSYDIIGGKIADDATNFTIVAYLAGTYGDIGTDEADEFCIKRLLPEKLKDQFCFRTQAALDCLEFVESEIIWKN